MPVLSILDLAFVPEGATPALALRHTLDLAQHAENWGYHRFWLSFLRVRITNVDRHLHGHPEV
jgi:hypothetical protein